ncbi:hypothetical protein J3E74DRAFT_380674 [Bipolaris maydis]|nr:hypothetical protein J3E74DRAFT_380674 [Bipolaris maydis]
MPVWAQDGDFAQSATRAAVGGDVACDACKRHLAADVHGNHVHGRHLRPALNGDAVTRPCKCRQGCRHVMSTCTCSCVVLCAEKTGTGTLESGVRRSTCAESIRAHHRSASDLIGGEAESWEFHGVFDVANDNVQVVIEVHLPWASAWRRGAG